MPTLLENLCLPVQDTPNLTELDGILESRIELGIESKRNKNSSISAWTGGRDVLYPKSTSLPLPPIFLVNKQLNTETQQVLSRIRPNYILDVVLYKELYLILTWLVIPQYRRKIPHSIDSIFCNLRIAGSFDGSGGRREYRGFRGGDGAGPAMSWVLYSLLERFLHFGPRWRSSEGEIKDIFVCKELVINVQTPTHVPSDWLASRPRSSSFRWSKKPSIRK